MREDQHRGEYGSIPTYHIVLSPQPLPPAKEETMLEGLTAEALLATEEALFQQEDIALEEIRDKEQMEPAEESPDQEN